MIKVLITTTNGRKYGFSVLEGRDFLSTLDKFLKENKLDVSQVKRVSVLCARDESTQCRAVKAAAAAIRFIPTLNQRRGKGK